MDHLAIPKGVAHADLPYLGTEEYDGGTLCDYPRRKGWTEAELGGNNSSGQRTSEEVNAFFQTWLFFGCLNRVFRSVGVKTKSSDFIRTREDGKKFLTTKLLLNFIQQWRNGKRRGGTWDTVESRQQSELENMLGRRKKNSKGVFPSPVELLLEEYRGYVWKYCGKGVAVSPEVAVVIATLEWTLSYWAMGICHSGWGRTDIQKVPEAAIIFLQERMLKAGWCPGDASHFVRQFEIDGMYYFGSLNSPRYEDNHSLCTEHWQECGYTTNDWKYTTRHVRDECKCKIIGAPANFLEIIQNGGTPIMSLVDGELSAVRVDTTKMRYVAISHVWADGMGNDLENALPLCQISRLQQLVNEVDHRRRTEPPPRPIQQRASLASTDNLPPQEPHVDRYANTQLVGFWTDTLCVPIRPEDYEHRISQIRKMQNIYSDASCVLALDRWVQDIPKVASITEKSSRLFLCNWQHRLWTCQEGVLAKTLYFQFSDGQQRLTDMQEEAELYTDGPRESTIPGIALSFIPAFNEGHFESFPLATRLKLVLLAIHSRTTSKKKDYTVCMATLLGLDPDPLLRINEGNDICKLRMRKFRKIVEGMPSGFSFTKDRPRFIPAGPI